MMNQDQIKGNLKDAAGKLQQKTGELLGDGKQQDKGAEKRVEGQVQKVVGNVKDSFNK
jgi:uncharacterized protein YjbJ (UPF0337 family)